MRQSSCAATTTRSGRPPSDTITLFPDLGPVPDARTEDVAFRPADLRRNRARFTATFSVRNPLHCEADTC